MKETQKRVDEKKKGIKEYVEGKRRMKGALLNGLDGRKWNEFEGIYA